MIPKLHDREWGMLIQAVRECEIRALNDLLGAESPESREYFFLREKRLRELEAKLREQRKAAK